MTVSVITACYNSERTIAHTIESVLAQKGVHIEYIVIDGGSKDRTLGIVRSYKTQISVVVSEPDNGIYFALNKGLSHATGDIIAILHADDFFVDENVLRDVISEFNRTKVDAVYGDLQYVKDDQQLTVFRTWHSGLYKHGMFLNGWMPPHPAFFARREIYERYGFFDTRLRSAADYELMLRFIHKYKIKLSYIPRVLVKMRVGGTSNRTLTNRLRANREDRLAWKYNDLKPHFYTLVLKPLRKIGQFFKKD